MSGSLNCAVLDAHWLDHIKAEREGPGPRTAQAKVNLGVALMQYGNSISNREEFKPLYQESEEVLSAALALQPDRLQYAISPFWAETGTRMCVHRRMMRREAKRTVLPRLACAGLHLIHYACFHQVVKWVESEPFLFCVVLAEPFLFCLGVFGLCFLAVPFRVRSWADRSDPASVGPAVKAGLHVRCIQGCASCRPCPGPPVTGRDLEAGIPRPLLAQAPDRRDRGG
jgi:hypothetical protein